MSAGKSYGIYHKYNSQIWHLFLKTASGDTKRLRQLRAPPQSVTIKRDAILCTGSRIKYLKIRFVDMHLFTLQCMKAQPP